MKFTAKVVFVSFMWGLMICNLNGKNINGTWFSYELDDLTIDTTGSVNFYGIENFSKDTWLHQVIITIHDSEISIDKSPVEVKNGSILYSASDGGFLSYRGVIYKVNDVYVASTKLIESDYYPKLIPDPPPEYYPALDTALKIYSIFKDHIRDTMNFHGIDRTNLPELQVRDFIIRPFNKVILVNNQMFYPYKKSGIILH